MTGMKEVTMVEFVFDANFHIQIPSRYIGHLEIKDVCEVTKRYAINCVATVKQAKSATFVIFREADREVDVPDACTIFGRFQRARDLTYIILHYDDESSEKIYMDWKCETYNYLENMYQRQFVSRLGDLYIAIGEHASLQDVHKTFPVSERDINNLREMVLGN